MRAVMGPRMHRQADAGVNVLAHDVVSRVMQAASLPRAVMAGVSLGGMIAIEELSCAFRSTLRRWC